jgi:hypothetical protein
MVSGSLGVLFFGENVRKHQSRNLEAGKSIFKAERGESGNSGCGRGDELTCL